MKKTISFLAVLFLLLAASGLAQAGSNPPGMMTSTVLSGIKVDHKNGNFYLNNLQATFLPQPSVKSKSIYPYNPDDGGKLWAILKKSDGTEVARYDFYAQLRKAPFWLLNSYKVKETQTGTQPASGRIHLDNGAYELDFFVEGTHYYHFPFQVDMLASESAFKPEDFYFLEGDWNNWGYFYYYDAQPGKPIQWKIWLRNKGLDSNKDAKVELQIKRGGALVCTNRPNTTYSLRPEWNRFEFDLIFPMKKTSGGAYFKAKDMIAKDGSYTLNMKVNGASIGQWKFKIASGKFQPKGRTVRGKADPKTFVEGGVDAFWYSK